MGWETKPDVYGPDFPYEMTWESVEFDVDISSEYNPDALFLKVSGPTNDPEWQDFELRYTTGKDWEKAQGGKKAEHLRNKDGFSRNSKMGRLIDHIVQNVPDLAAVLMERGDPTEAATWQGITVQMGALEYKVRDDKLVMPVPIKLISADGGGKAGKSTEDKAEVIERLKVIAQESESHSDFVNEALSVVGRDKALLSQVTDDSEEGFYEQNKGE